MTKPFVNLAEVEFTDVEENGFYTSKRAQFSASIGARQLGYNLTELPPGSAQCPFHSHRAEEEMFLILEGEESCASGTRRTASENTMSLPAQRVDRTPPTRSSILGL